MLLYIEDQKREKEPQVFEESTRLLLSRLPSTLRFLHPSRCRNQDTQYVFVCHTVTVREASRSP